MTAVLVVVLMVVMVLAGDGDVGVRSGSSVDAVVAVVDVTRKQ